MIGGFRNYVLRKVDFTEILRVYIRDQCDLLYMLGKKNYEDGESSDGDILTNLGSDTQTHP